MTRLGTSAQVILILLISTILGLLNNLQSSRSIDWVKRWPPYSEVSAKAMLDENVPETEPETGVPVNQETELIATEIMVTGNQGITDIEIATATKIHQYTKDLTLWLDARDEELFLKGHIEGAYLLNYYEQSNYMDAVLEVIAQLNPVSLVVYCKGKDCTDSHFLAEDLFNQGFNNIFVYRGGFDEWFKAGFPVEGELAEAATSLPPQASSESAASRAQLLDEKPPGMYLEHVIRDLLPFFMGILILIAWKKVKARKATVFLSAIVVGLFFIWAGVPKILGPLAFAKSIWNYDLAPPATINLAALIMPWLEVIGGGCLVLGVYRQGGRWVTSALLVLFIVAVGLNLLRGHEFNCGCLSASTYFTDQYLVGWNDKYLLLLRDIGLLVLAVLGVKKIGTETRLEWPKP